MAEFYFGLVIGVFMGILSCASYFDGAIKRARIREAELKEKLVKEQTEKPAPTMRDKLAALLRETYAGDGAVLSTFDATAERIITLFEHPGAAERGTK